MELDVRSIGIIAALGAVALYSSVRLWWTGASRRWRIARQRRRAAKGERDAESLLAGIGYRVIERQAEARVVYRIDGKPMEVSVRADLLVTRHGRRYVAEVKTGEKAPSPTNRATRRQLLEYGHAFHVDGLLLVDPENGLVREIGLPGRGSSTARWPWLATGIVIGAAALWVLRSFYG